MFETEIFHPQQIRGDGETDYRAETTEAPATESQNRKSSLKKTEGFFFAKIFEISILTSKTGVILHVAILIFEKLPLQSQNSSSEKVERIFFCKTI